MVCRTHGTGSRSAAGSKSQGTGHLIMVHERMILNCPTDVFEARDLTPEFREKRGQFLCRCCEWQVFDVQMDASAGCGDALPRSWQWLGCGYRAALCSHAFRVSEKARCDHQTSPGTAPMFANWNRVRFLRCWAAFRMNPNALCLISSCGFNTPNCRAQNIALFNGSCTKLANPIPPGLHYQIHFSQSDRDSSADFFSHEELVDCVSFVHVYILTDADLWLFGIQGQE